MNRKPTKSEAENAIRHLVHKWAKETGFNRFDQSPENEPSFYAFQSWLDEKHYGHYLRFRSVAGPRYDGEIWFEEELGRKRRK